jgi:hypothetical protein
VKRYRRIEITAFRRRVSVTSGEIVLNNSDNRSAAAEEGVELNDGESGEAIEFESAEGQLILVDVLRSLERRLSPEARATMWAAEENPAVNHSRCDPARRKLRSFCQFIYPKALRFARKEK